MLTEVVLVGFGPLRRFGFKSDATHLFPRLATDTQLSSFGVPAATPQLEVHGGVNCEVQCEQRYGGLYADGNGTLADTSQWSIS